MNDVGIPFTGEKLKRGRYLNSIFIKQEEIAVQYADENIEEGKKCSFLLSNLAVVAN